MDINMKLQCMLTPYNHHIKHCKFWLVSSSQSPSCSAWPGSRSRRRVLLGYPQTSLRIGQQPGCDVYRCTSRWRCFRSEPHSPARTPRSTEAQPHSCQSTSVKSIIKQKTRDPYFTIPAMPY